MAKREPPPPVRSRRPPLGLAASAAGFDSRRAAFACGGVVFLVCLFGYAGTSWPLVLYQLAADVPALTAWLLAALGVGALLLPLFRIAENDRLLAVVTCVALGLGSLGLLTLAMGLAGVLNRATSFGLLGAGGACAVVQALRFRSRHRPGEVDAAFRAWLRVPAGWNWLWLAAMPLLAMAVVGALVPPGLLWSPDEPHGYDVVEYHLQVPREWYEAGRIVPLRHNVFSYFPFAVEMHYLLAMHLRGGPWRGMYLAQLMHAAHVVLAVLALHAFTRRSGTHPAAAVFASVIAATVPWLTLLAPIAYNEGGVLLYGTLALGWALHAVEKPGLGRRSLVIAGVMSGLACCVKLTAVPLVLLGVPAALVAGVVLGRRGQVRAAVAGSALFVLAGVVVFAPYLVRNARWSGNPLFPEAARVLGAAHFTPAQVERWHRANHLPGAEYSSPAGRVKAFGLQVWGDWRFAYVLLPLAVVSLAFARPGEPGWWLLVWMLVGLSVFWLTLTHLQGRFFLLAVPPAALLVARVKWGRWVGLGCLVTVAAVLAALGSLHGLFAARVAGPRGLAVVVGAPGEAFGELPILPPELKAIPPDATLTLIGEARAFWFARSMRLMRYRTVFDVDVPTGGDVIDAWRGAPVPNEWLLIEPTELNRFSRTYAGIPAPPADVRERRSPYVVAPAGSGAPPPGDASPR